MDENTTFVWVLTGLRENCINYLLVFDEPSLAQTWVSNMYEELKGDIHWKNPSPTYYGTYLGGMNWTLVRRPVHHEVS